MAVEKTYTIVIKYEKGDAGLKRSRRIGSEFSDYTEPELAESDQAYKELQKIVVKRLEQACSVSQGINSAVISGEVSET